MIFHHHQTPRLSVEQLIRSVESQLRGDNIGQWLDAVSQITRPMQKLIVTQSDLDLGEEEVEDLKQLCL